jgi:hypothetical protein
MGSGGASILKSKLSEPSLAEVKIQRTFSSVQ